MKDHTHIFLLHNKASEVRKDKRERINILQGGYKNE